MFEGIMKFFKKIKKSEKEDSKDTAKERLHLVLAQDRANISADFLELMKQEIIEVIKKYIDIDEKEIDVRLTNKEGEDGSLGAPALYANIPIITIKNEARKLEGEIKKEESKIEEESTDKTETISETEENTNLVEKDNEETVSTVYSVPLAENIGKHAMQSEEQNKETLGDVQEEDNSSETNNDNVNEVENEKKDS